VVVRLLPSGILRDGTLNVLAQGMVVDPQVLVGELDDLARRGVGDVAKRVVLSNRAHLVLPYHREMDALRERAAPVEKAIGTTKKGIGPTLEDKMRRTGVLAGDLKNPTKLRERIEGALFHWAPQLSALGGTVPKVEEVLNELAPLRERLIPLLADTSSLINDALSANKKVLLEGAQGTLLDVDHGTYPFVTSSSPIAAGAAVGAGIGPRKITCVVGILKAYCPRVGAGPFPTELLNAEGEHLRTVGIEFGSVTGRPRRTGWFDLPAYRYASRINGLDGVAITKLDVLTGMPSLKVCIAYDTPQGRVEDLPIDVINENVGAAKPVFKEFEGWSESLGEVRSIDALPRAAREYVRFIEEKGGVPLYSLSVGASRRQTIVLKDPFAEPAA
jgi:adenylosuccinate synthase